MSGLGPMGASFVRPPAAELIFRLYDRPLHPELFEVLASRRVESHGHRLTARITRAGHVLEWAGGGLVLAEVTAAAGQELPERGRRLAHRLGGGRGGRCELPGGVRYQVSSHVEALSPAQFGHVHRELLDDGRRKGLLVHLDGETCYGLPPLGVVIAEALPRCLSVSTFHTFPADLAVVKTQSLIERV